jgi:hypothetical protein
MDDTQNNDTASLENEIQSVKQRAVEALGPLVDGLDAPADRKFEIYMTALRASASSHLLAKALSAAEQIENPNAKAEALIDSINEATYLLKEA